MQCVACGKQFPIAWLFALIAEPHRREARLARQARRRIPERGRLLILVLIRHPGLARRRPPVLLLPLRPVPHLVPERLRVPLQAEAPLLLRPARRRNTSQTSAWDK